MDTLNYHLDKLVGKNNWISFCIHLDRCLDRELSFKNWADYVGLDFNWWKATDRLDLTEDDYKICDVIINFKHKSDGATACRLSHMKLYKFLLEQFPSIQYFLIFEDDAGFTKGYESTQNKNKLFEFLKHVNDYKFNWDMLLFGYHDTGMKQLENINENLIHVKQAHRLHAFLVSRSALEYVLYFCLLDELKQLPIDWIFDYIRKSAITLGPSQTIIDQVDDCSYINNDCIINKDDISNENTCEFISRLGLMKLCDQYPEIYYENNQIKFKNKISIQNKLGDKIYIQNSLLESFVKQLADKFHQPFILISGFKEKEIDKNLLVNINNCNKILFAYIENIEVDDNLKKIKCLPQGINFSSFPYKNCIYSESILKQLNKNVSNNITSICFSPYIHLEHSLIINIKKDKLNYINEMKNYLFVICSSYEEIFEVLLLGHYAIGYKVPKLSFFDKLPISFIDSENDLNENFLKEKQNQFNENKYDLERLKINYWKKIFTLNSEIFKLLYP